ncbi:alpha-E domain-containing protein [Hyphomicrobium sp. NDB2Meth4]|uniref:alpha-E domain-containing protein n=1 Tax=Hyphomicrobium sp. NDB2Meth4 TaxID=1892846 RepID=UPI0009316269|nr:alpha-E domain-containing protein [Hyphomicrobium sp. NDB2Meth4]
MLGRTANDLYWLARYVERAENMARLTEVGYRIVLLPRDGDGTHEEWRSTLSSAGCAQGYFSKFETLNTRDVINYLLFDFSNPSSVKSCLAAARRNGRAQRTSLTRDMWESLNAAWIEFSNINPANITAGELPRVLDWVRSRSALYRGALLNTILRNDTFFFSQLGTFLERADNTARILDVKYYVLLPQIEMVGGGVDAVQWGAILRSVSAHRSYRWVYKENYKPWRIAEYLILNQAMPRSLRSCYDEINIALSDLANLYGERSVCHETAAGTRNLLSSGNIDDIFQSGLHEFIEDFIIRNNRLGNDVAEVYHFNG